MSSLVSGIHHITAIASDPQATFEFYTQILGLRLVKKTVNQDDVATYHLFFGDHKGDPGMDLTFFTFLPPQRGKRGAGQVTTISLAVPHDSLSFWQHHFDHFKVKHEPIVSRFGSERLVFYDQDDQRLELVAVDEAELKPMAGEIWVTPEVGREVAIRGFYSARLTVTDLAAIKPVLTTIFGAQATSLDRDLTLFKINGATRAPYLEVEENQDTDWGIPGAGTVHHIAFAVASEAELETMQTEIARIGLRPTEVIDRYYFKSVYFRTPAGILCELATLGPGFTVDQSEAELGLRLALPPFLEPYRTAIESHLPPLETSSIEGRKWTS